MKLHNAWPFTRWLFGRMFGGVSNLYGIYDEMVCDEPALAAVPTLGIAVASIIPIFLIFAMLGIFSYSLYGWLFFTLLTVANYFRIILREQYKQFAIENKEFLDKFKT
jgi:hypothetical protein